MGNFHHQNGVEKKRGKLAAIEKELQQLKRGQFEDPSLWEKEYAALTAEAERGYRELRIENFSSYHVLNGILFKI